MPQPSVDVAKYSHAGPLGEGVQLVMSERLSLVWCRSAGSDVPTTLIVLGQDHAGWCCRVNAALSYPLCGQHTDEYPMIGEEALI